MFSDKTPFIKASVNVLRNKLYNLNAYNITKQIEAIRL